MIQPPYITFEQAKWLKEKGFDLPVFSYFRNENSVWNFYPIFEQNPDNWNSDSYIKCYSRPEQWQVCEWLRIKHGIWILIIPTVTSNWTYKTIRVIGEVDNDVISGLKSVSDLPPYKDVCGYDFSTPQEAYSAAFDCILKELI